MKKGWKITIQCSLESEYSSIKCLTVLSSGCPEDDDVRSGHFLKNLFKIVWKMENKIFFFKVNI